MSVVTTSNSAAVSIVARAALASAVATSLRQA